jgi:hypothetical protein
MSSSWRTYLLLLRHRGTAGLLFVTFSLVFSSCATAARSARPIRSAGAKHNVLGQYVFEENQSLSFEAVFSGSSFQAVEVVDQFRRNSSPPRFLENYRIYVSGHASSKWLHISLVPLLGPGESINRLHGTSLGSEECYIVDLECGLVVRSSFQCGYGWDDRDPRLGAIGSAPSDSTAQPEVQMEPATEMTMDKMARLPVGVTAKDIARMEWEQRQRASLKNERCSCEDNIEPSRETTPGTRTDVDDSR